jgi:hypothetical protein
MKRHGANIPAIREKAKLIRQMADDGISPDAIAEMIDVSRPRG